MGHGIRRRRRLIVGFAWAVASALLAPPAAAQTDPVTDQAADTTGAGHAAGAGPATPPQVSALTLSQVHLRMPSLMAYLRVRGADDLAVTDFGEEGLAATVADGIVPVTNVAAFDAAEAGVAYLFLLDVSRSLRPQQFLALRDALRPWFSSMGPRDQAAIVTFGNVVEILEDFTADTAALAARLVGLRPDESRTLLYDGMMRAMEMMARQDAALPDRRVIVVVSDGIDSVIGGVSEPEVIGRLGEVRIPVFGVGLYDPPRTREKEDGLQTLGAFARTSGGQFVRADTLGAAEVYRALTRYAHDVVVAELDCARCPADGRVHRLQVTLEAGGRTLADGAYVRLVPAPVAPAEPVPVAAPWWRGGWGVGGAVVVLVAVILLAVLVRRRRTPAEADVDAVDPRESAGVSGGELHGAIQSAAGFGTEPAPVIRPLRIRLTPLGMTARADGRSVDLLDEIRIGRDADTSEVAFPDDPEISSIHCVLIRRDPFLVVRDLESTNGTTVNGVPVRGEQRVEDNDVIGIGRSELRLSIHGTADEHRS